MAFRDSRTETISLNGMYPATVMSTNGDSFIIANQRVGMAADIYYSVVVQGPNGPLFFENVVPTHRRPSSTTLIVTALPGDRCLAMAGGQEFEFIIFEGLFSEEC